MPSIQSVEPNGLSVVEFRLPPEAALSQAWLAGEFNEWSTDELPLERRADGSLSVEVPLEPGSYRFRYYLGDGEWENDWAADAYVDNEHGGQDSLVVVPPAPAPPPPAMGETGDERSSGEAVKTAARKKAAGKKAAAKKAGAAKAAAKKEPARKQAAKKAAKAKKAPPPNG